MWLVLRVPSCTSGLFHIETCKDSTHANKWQRAEMICCNTEVTFFLIMIFLKASASFYKEKNSCSKQAEGERDTKQCHKKCTNNLSAETSFLSVATQFSTDTNNTVLLISSFSRDIYVQNLITSKIVILVNLIKCQTLLKTLR